MTARADMEARLARLRPLLAPAGFIWVSWPKKASKVADRHHRGRHPRASISCPRHDLGLLGAVQPRTPARHRSGGRQGLRRRCDLVRPEADDPQGNGVNDETLLRTSRIIIYSDHHDRLRLQCDLRKRVGPPRATALRARPRAYRARGCKPRCGQCFSFAREIIAAETAPKAPAP